jgi:glycine cleavage system aminomethyltransferase T
MSQSKSVPHSPYLPFDPEVADYNTTFTHLSPWQFEGWKAESLSWKNSCYLHAGLNPASPYRLQGPGALSLLRDACINGFTKFSIGCSKHAVMCNKFGNVMADGMVLRTGEEDFTCYFLNPYIDYLVASGRYDVSGEDLSGKTFLFQVAGPQSLAVLESATADSLRDIEFLWHRPSSIPHEGRTIPVRVFRLGVARTLAYEVHGHIEDALDVYRAIQERGEQFGIQRIGMQVYGMHHTEGGFAQSYLHFLPAYTEDPDFMAFLDGGADAYMRDLPGSAGTVLEKRYANPAELGWAHMIKFDHEFVGRAALERIVTEPHRRIVTLEWNQDDVVEIFSSQFNANDDEFMDFAANPIWTAHNSVVFSDDVVAGDDLVGISSGRVFSYFYRQMLSLALLKPEHAQIGDEVDVIWGRPGNRSKRIRATVARFPYLDLPKNAEIDATKLP